MAQSETAAAVSDPQWDTLVSGHSTNRPQEVVGQFRSRSLSPSGAWGSSPLSLCLPTRIPTRMRTVYLSLYTEIG